MPRLTFAARIGVIAILGIGLVWLVAIAVFYVSQAADGGGVRPPPAQLAALADLLERTPSGDRPPILAAVTSDTLQATVEPGIEIGESQPRLLFRFGVRDVVAYREALGGRAMSVSLLDGHRFRSVLRAAPEAVAFRIALSTGETLVVETHGAILVTRLGLPVGFGAGLFGTFIALIALYAMIRETKPLARLAAAVDRVDLSGPPVLLPEARRSAPEIRALVAAFNRLQTRLSQLMRARLAMLGGISHDVRTFATRLRLRVERLPEGEDRDRAVADIADMIRLLDDALLASRAGAGELTRELVEFDQLLRAEVAEGVAQGAAIALLGVSSGATVVGDRLALRRIVANLIDNALKYGQRARVDLRRDAAASIILTVDDDGPGIPPDQRELLLEPFVRLETSRNRRTGGAGLGLAVVRSLVEAHDGSVAISDAPGGSARVTVTLPVFEAR